jgi:hypothetical protein
MDLIYLYLPLKWVDVGILPEQLFWMHELGQTQILKLLKNIGLNRSPVAQNHKVSKKYRLIL